MLFVLQDVMYLHPLIKEVEAEIAEKKEWEKEWAALVYLT